jgi:hypothetical protein
MPAGGQSTARTASASDGGVGIRAGATRDLDPVAPSDQAAGRHQFVEGPRCGDESCGLRDGREAAQLRHGRGSQGREPDRSIPGRREGDGRVSDRDRDVRCERNASLRIRDGAVQLESSVGVAAIRGRQPAQPFRGRAAA